MGSVWSSDMSPDGWPRFLWHGYLPRPNVHRRVLVARPEPGTAQGRSVLASIEDAGR